jgi:hypothetical protein
MPALTLTEALRRKFKSPRDAVRALGLDVDLLDNDDPTLRQGPQSMTTHFTRPRRFGKDEEASEQLRQMLDDPDINIADLVAAAVEHCPDDQQEELHRALRELSEDRRGPHAWSADRLEMRRLSKDMRDRRARDRRLGRDFGPENLTGRGSDPIENFGRSEANRQIDEAAGDRRRMGADQMAMDGRVPPGLARLWRS